VLRRGNRGVTEEKTRRVQAAGARKPEVLRIVGNHVFDDRDFPREDDGLRRDGPILLTGAASPGAATERQVRHVVRRPGNRDRGTRGAPVTAIGDVSAPRDHGVGTGRGERDRQRSAAVAGIPPGEPIRRERRDLPPEHRDAPAVWGPVTPLAGRSGSTGIAKRVGAGHGLRTPLHGLDPAAMLRSQGGRESISCFPLLVVSQAICLVYVTPELTPVNTSR